MSLEIFKPSKKILFLVILGIAVLAAGFGVK